MKRLPLHDLHAARGAVFTEAFGWTLPSRYGEPAQEYEAAVSTVALSDLGFTGKALFSGSDRREFLQGLLTNDVARLGPGDASPACLLTAKGKLVADFRLYERPSDFLALSLDPVAPARALEALSKHFLLSDTEGRDVSEALGALFLAGPKAAFLLEKAFGAPFPDGRAVTALPSSDDSLWACRSPIFGLEGFLVLSPAEASPRLWEACATAGRDLGLRFMGHEAAEMFRVEAGVPRFGADVDGDVYPIEANLEDAVSYDKGCYLGQETTARLKYKGRPPRRLTAVRTEAPAVPGDAVTAEGRALGTVSSSARSPRLGAALSLTLLPVEEAREGRSVLVAGKRGTVVPFPRRIDSIPV